ERPARPDEVVPPARRRVALAGFARRVAVAGEGVADQHGVGGVGAEATPGLVGHLGIAERAAALEHEPPPLGEGHEAAVADGVAGTPGARGREGAAGEGWGPGGATPLGAVYAGV